MVREIEQIQREVAERAGSQRLDRRVIAVMAKSRATCSCRQQQGQAYQNRPLPIGHGQTISQPYIVALMTDLAAASSPATRCSRSAPARATRRR